MWLKVTQNDESPARGLTGGLWKVEGFTLRLDPTRSVVVAVKINGTRGSLWG